MKLLVRRLEYEDLKTRVAWFNTYSVYTQMAVDVPLSLGDTQQWFAKNALNNHRRDFCFVLETAGEPGAMGGLTDIDYYHRRAELYIVANPEKTGKGIGKRSTIWLCNYGFLHLGLSRIYLHTMASNEIARHLYEKLGFVHEGVLRHHILHNGQMVDRHVQSLLRSDWEPLSWCTTPPIQFMA